MIKLGTRTIFISFCLVVQNLALTSLDIARVNHAGLFLPRLHVASLHVFGICIANLPAYSSSPFGFLEFLYWIIFLPHRMWIVSNWSWIITVCFHWLLFIIHCFVTCRYSEMNFGQWRFSRRHCTLFVCFGMWTVGTLCINTSYSTVPWAPFSLLARDYDFRFPEREGCKHELCALYFCS